MNWWLMIKVFIFSPQWKLANVLKWFCVPFMKHNFFCAGYPKFKRYWFFYKLYLFKSNLMVTIIQCDLLHVKSNMVSASFFTPLKIWSRNFWRPCWSFYKLNWNQFVDEINSGSNFVWSSFKHFLQNTFFDS